MERITASGDRSLRTRPSMGCEMNGSTIAISACEARSLTARAQASIVTTVAGSSGSMRNSILPPSNPIRAMLAASYPVNRSSILNPGPGQPAAFHGADDHLVVQRAEQQQVLDDVRGAEHAVHPGPRQ